VLGSALKAAVDNATVATNAHALCLSFVSKVFPPHQKKGSYNTFLLP
jgi:hypothetical protein